MSIITHIIDTTTLEDGDFVSFSQDGVEYAGVFKCFNNDGNLDVDVIMLNGIVSVEHEAVTDILS